MNGTEEAVRRDYVRILIDDYGYQESEIETEFPIPRGSRNRDRADIAVFGSAHGRDPAKDLVGIVETKKPDEGSGLAQLKSYMTATSAIWGVWTNGESIEYLCKPKGESSVYADLLNNIPVRGQRLEDVGKLDKSDLKPYSGTALKVSFRRILNTLYANTNISRREKLGNEMIKLIFAKIRDETTFPDNPRPSTRATAKSRSVSRSASIACSRASWRSTSMTDCSSLTTGSPWTRGASLGSSANWNAAAWWTPPRT